MINSVNLGQMNELLRAYDVRDGGWEHEGKSPAENARHMYLEITGAANRKEFDKPEVVKTETAPDALAYALRLLRHSGIAHHVAITNGDEQLRLARQYHAQTGTRPIARAAMLTAAKVLYPIAHGVEHRELAVKAEMDLPMAAVRAARLLTFSAVHDARRFQFGLHDAFQSRLGALRVRHDVFPRFEMPETEVDLPEPSTLFMK